MSKIDVFNEKIKGKNIVVIGIGISNMPLIRYLVSHGASVRACDKRTKEELGEKYEELKALNVSLNLGEDYLSDIEGDIIFKTPGMRFDTPELLAAKAKGVHITSEMEEFVDICPSHIIAVTGSDGKTTTTTLISKMLEAEGYKTWVGGNIGTPLLTRAGEMSEDDWVVLELSSFQLHTMRKSPEIAVITNISPNHLDMHKDYQEYIDAKKNIMLYQSESDKLIVNADNEVANEIGKEAKGEVKYFSRRKKTEIYLDGDMIKCGGYDMLNIRDIKIPGMHNVENYMAAIAATEGLVSAKTVNKIAKNFGGVEHRIEFVRELDGVKYYNSSIDSSPNRTVNTLNVFSGNVVMIAGGKDKGIPYDAVGPAIADHAKALILIGATADKIAEALEKTGRAEGVCVRYVKTYEEAVNTAKSLAENGDVVLLSPASTSFDMFNNFEERGKLFKDLVNKL